MFFKKVHRIVNLIRIHRIGYSTIYFETLAKRSYGGIERHDYLIIDAHIIWEQIQDQTFKHGLPPPEVPVINFTTSTIIAVNYGWRATGGYSIEITKIIETAFDFYVYVEETSPSPEQAVIAVITFPYHLVKTQKLTKNVKFITISN